MAFRRFLAPLSKMKDFFIGLACLFIVVFVVVLGPVLNPWLGPKTEDDLWP